MHGDRAKRLYPFFISPCLAVALSGGGLIVNDGKCNAIYYNQRLTCFL